MLGVCVVKDFFREGISLETAMSQVTSYAVSDMFYLPPGTIPPMVMPFDPTAPVPLCLVSVSSPSMNEKELYDIAYFELRNRLQSIQGVIAPAVYGGKLRRILAYVDRMRLESRGLGPMDMVRALKRQSVFIPAGNLKAGNLDYQIFANSMPAKVEELNEMPIAVRDGRPVLVGDVADVQDSSQIQTNVVRINGRRQVYIPIYRQPGANTIEIVQSIDGNLERIQQRLKEMDPSARDLSIEVVVDQSVYVRNALRALQLGGASRRRLRGAGRSGIPAQPAPDGVGPRHPPAGDAGGPGRALFLRSDAQHDDHRRSGAGRRNSDRPVDRGRRVGSPPWRGGPATSRGGPAGRSGSGGAGARVHGNLLHRVLSGGVPVRHGELSVQPRGSGGDTGDGGIIPVLHHPGAGLLRQNPPIARYGDTPA